MIERFYSGDRAASREGLAATGVVLRRSDVRRARRGFWGLLHRRAKPSAATSKRSSPSSAWACGPWAWSGTTGTPRRRGMGRARRGLTPFGKEVVRVMQEVGMIVDVSHLSERGFWDVIRSAGPRHRLPLNARALCDHPRNLTDPQLRLADTGGVVGITFARPFTAGGKAGIERWSTTSSTPSPSRGPRSVWAAISTADGTVPGLEDVTGSLRFGRCLRRGVHPDEGGHDHGGNWPGCSSGPCRNSAAGIIRAEQAYYLRTVRSEPRF